MYESIRLISTDWQPDTVRLHYSIVNEQTNLGHDKNIIDRDELWVYDINGAGYYSGTSCSGVKFITNASFTSINSSYL